MAAAAAGVAASLSLLGCCAVASRASAASDPTETPTPPSSPAAPEPTPAPEPAATAAAPASASGSASPEPEEEFDTETRLSQRMLGFTPAPAPAPGPSGWSHSGWKPKRSRSAEADRLARADDGTDVSWLQGDHDYHEVKAGCIDPAPPQPEPEPEPEPPVAFADGSAALASWRGERIADGTLALLFYPVRGDLSALLLAHPAPRPTARPLFVGLVIAQAVRCVDSELLSDLRSQMEASPAQFAVVPKRTAFPTTSFQPPLIPDVLRCSCCWLARAACRC